MIHVHAGLIRLAHRGIGKKRHVDGLAAWTSPIRTQSASRIQASAFGPGAAQTRRKEQPLAGAPVVHGDRNGVAHHPATVRTAWGGKGA